MSIDAVTGVADGIYAVARFEVGTNAVMGQSVGIDAHFFQDTFTWYSIVLLFVHRRIFSYYSSIFGS